MPIPEAIEKNIVSNNPNYKHCDLSSCGLSDFDIESKLINLLIKNTHLTSINLYRNNLTQKGIIPLFRHLPPSITVVKIGYNNITDENFEALLNNLPPHVIELDLSMNGSLSDKAAKIAFKYCEGKRLKINVYHTDVSKEYADRLYTGCKSPMQDPIYQSQSFSTSSSLGIFRGIFHKVSDKQTPNSTTSATNVRELPTQAL